MSTRLQTAAMVFVISQAALLGIGHFLFPATWSASYALALTPLAIALSAAVSQAPSRAVARSARRKHRRNEP